jgi:hypothetical protein
VGRPMPHGGDVVVGSSTMDASRRLLSTPSTVRTLRHGSRVRSTR